jgi:hypothetical protein
MRLLSTSLYKGKRERDSCVVAHFAYHGSCLLVSNASSGAGGEEAQ